MDVDVVYILLPVHNRRETTRRFVTCLAAQSHQNYRLILIDDGSSDGTAQMVQEQVPGVTVIRGTGDWWWGGSLQQGYLWLKSRRIDREAVVLIMNDDTEFDDDFLAKGVALVRELPRTFVLASCYDRETGVFIDAGVSVEWSALRFRRQKPGGPVNCLSTRGLFMSAGDFMSTGGFHPKLLPHYLSDYEFTIRALRKGIRLVCSERIRLSLDTAKTGDHGRVTAATLLSKRSARNPLAWSAFLFLTCPSVFLPINLARIWGSAALGIWRSINLSRG